MKRAAWWVCLVATTATVTCVVFTVCRWRATSMQIAEVPYDEYRRQAVEMIRAESGNLVNLSTALIAGLWAAVVVGKENRLHLRDAPNVLLFILGNAALAGSLFLSLRYTRLLSQLYWDMGPLLSQGGIFADVVNSPWVRLQYQLSAIYFFLGVGLAGGSIFSARYFRRDQ